MTSVSPLRRAIDAGNVVRSPSGPEVSAEALIDHVAASLSVHKRPRDVVFVDSLPRNPMGKVLKTQLR